MTGCYPDTFGNPFAELRGCYYFRMTTVAENQALKFVVYNHFQ